MEELTENKNRKCLYCGNFEGYYTKGLRRFERTEQGYCCKQHKIVNNEECCEFWRSCSRSHFMRKRAASRALYEILMDISAIRQILQENQDEGKNL